MKSKPEYTKLKQYVLDNNWSVEQAQSFTRQQVAQLINMDFSDYSKFIALKKALVETLQNRDDEANLQGVKDQLVGYNRVWLTNRFPNVEFDRGFENGKKFIRIWLEGKR